MSDVTQLAYCTICNKPCGPNEYPGATVKHWKCIPVGAEIDSSAIRTSHGVWTYKVIATITTITGDELLEALLDSYGQP